MRLSFVPIYKRELRGYFQNPGVYAMLALFLGISGVFVFSAVKWFSTACIERQMRPQFGMQPLNFMEYVVRDTFGLIAFLFIFFMPLLTMRLFAEEKKSGTFELLATCPVTDWGLVIGKYLAAVTIMAIFLVASLVFPITLSRLGETEWPVIAAGYLGLFLIGIAYVSFGTFASSLTENQIIAGVVTFCGLLGFYVIGFMGIGRGGLLGMILEALSISQHSDNLIRGRILSEDVAYFFVFAVAFLFLANHVLESRRWRV